MCTHQAHATVHTTGTKIDFFDICAFCVPYVCRYFCDPMLNKNRKVQTISFPTLCRTSKTDIPGALWLDLKSEKSFEKKNFFFEKCWKFENFRIPESRKVKIFFPAWPNSLWLVRRSKFYLINMLALFLIPGATLSRWLRLVLGIHCAHRAHLHEFGK